MVKLSRNFFTDREILFVGYSSRNNAYSKEIFKAFTDNQMKVYPYNTKENANYDTKVYKSLKDIPVVPKTAFVLLNKENTTKAVKELVDKGVRKILFRSKNNVDPAVAEECEKAGIQTAYGCPMMVFGTGLHKFHALLAGVK